eukprot:TRINITY_DN8131_c0_g1_i2.p1 TRINITY_DN8131_c0_g1~~TRINITY_DN8131_c0_g1_i2.p1  ORF type:complete len:226 (+),score=56.87 TRINITY_DN8131_c0_g1_i2:312-989(+)
MIGKGVRFNAEKKQVGKFHSTKIWEFSMNCHLCSNKIKCQTDPENTDYKFVEGAYKILDTSEATDAEFIRDPKEVERIRNDPFAKLENQKEDIEKAETGNQKIKEILEIQEKHKDNYDLNLMLRKRFRQEKKQLEEEETVKKQPKNFGMELLPPTAMDKITAEKIRYKSLDPYRKNRMMKREEIKSESIFTHKKKNDNVNLALKQKSLPKSTKQNLIAQILVRDS